MRLLILAFIAFLFCSYTLVCPTLPQPLRKLVKNCQVIIEGTVLRTAALDAAENPREIKHWSHKASIVVINLLQGKTASDTIEVFFNPDMICPLPDRYPEKAHVLAFLDPAPQGNGFYTHGLSYGVKILPQEGMEVYKDRIKELQAIIKPDNASAQKEQTVDWLVKCALNSYTRLEGTYELSPGTYFLASGGSGNDEIKIYGLNDQQKTLLFEVLLKIDKLTYSELGLIDLTWNHDNDQLVKLMNRYIRQKNTESFAGELMKRINAILVDPRLEKIIGEYDTARRENNPGKKQQKLLKDFIALL